MSERLGRDSGKPRPSNNERLRDEADLLLKKCSLPELLATYQSWFIGGSYNYGLMCWRDLDVYVLDPRLDLRNCFEIGYEVTRRLAAKKSRFTNNVGADPSGLYWGIKLGDERRARGNLICGFWIRQVTRNIQNTVTISGYGYHLKRDRRYSKLKRRTGDGPNTGTRLPAT